LPWPEAGLTLCLALPGYAQCTWAAWIHASAESRRRDARGGWSRVRGRVRFVMAGVNTNYKMRIKVQVKAKVRVRVSMRVHVRVGIRATASVDV